MKNIIKNYWMIIVCVIVGLGALCADSYYGLNTELFGDVLGKVFDVLIVVAGFWVTLYLLFIELYKDRYPYNYVEKKYLVALKSNIKYIAFCSGYGLVVIARENYLLEDLFYVLISALTIIKIGKHVYDTSKTMMISNYVQMVCAELSEQFCENECTIKDATFEQLSRVFEECIVKEEYSVAQEISKRSGEVFREFMKNSIAFIDKGKKREDIEKSFRKIASFGKRQLDKCKEIESTVLKSDLLRQQYKNLCFCIEANQFEFFKIYIDELLNLTRDAQRDKADELVTDTYSLYSRVLDKLLEEKKHDWIKYLLKELFDDTMGISYFYTNDYVEEFIKLLVLGMQEECEDDTYELMFKMIENITFRISGLNNSLSSAIVYYVIIFNSLKNNCERKGYYERFIQGLFDDTRNTCSDKRWIEFKFHCIRELKKDGYCKEKVDEYLVRLLSKVIELREAYRGEIMLPDYKEQVYTGIYSKERMEKISSDYMYLFIKSITSDNLAFYHETIRSHDECILHSLKENKDIQCDLFHDYIKLIYRTKWLANKQFYEMTFVSIDEVLKGLDKDKKISEAFGDNIISEFEKIATRVDVCNDDVVLRVIEFLHDFEDDQYNFCNKLEKKKNLARAIYNIGISCIENDYEDGLRKASNALGWMTINAIKQGTVELVKYRIDLASRMLDVSRKMNVSKKTETFLVTLFTTVGMYSYKDASYAPYRNMIMEILQKEEMDVINTAIEIRTYENDMWDSLMENNTQEYVKLFRKDFNKYKKKQ